MSTTEIAALVRVIAVIGLVVTAALLATPPNRVPLALRALAKMLGKGRPSSAPSSVPTVKKLLAFALVLLAFILAKI